MLETDVVMIPTDGKNYEKMFRSSEMQPLKEESKHDPLGLIDDEQEDDKQIDGIEFSIAASYTL